MSKFIKNSIMQYLLIITQHIFPLLTYPYITRVLEPDKYGVIIYITSLMVYFQYIIDYGFTLSSTKKIAQNINNKKEIEIILGMTIQAKLMLSFLTIILFILITPFIFIIRSNILLSILYICPVILSVFLPDYLFRGIQQMEIFTIRFFIMKSISTIFTFILVQDKNDIFYIPLLNILSTVIAIIITWIQIKKKYLFKVRFVSMHKVLLALKYSSTFFISTITTTAFGVFNTFILGVMSIKSTEIGLWGAYYNLIISAQSLYSPIINSLYPHMVAYHDYKLIKKLLCLFMPLIFMACVMTYIFAPNIIKILCGDDYINGINIFRKLIPILIISFPILIMNYPILGAINREKETAKLTIYGALFNVIGLIFLIIIKKFTLDYIAILRCLTECLLLFFVLFYVYRYSEFFTNKKRINNIIS